MLRYAVTTNVYGYEYLLCDSMEDARVMAQLFLESSYSLYGTPKPVELEWHNWIVNDDVKGLTASCDSFRAWVRPIRIKDNGESVRQQELSLLESYNDKPFCAAFAAWADLSRDLVINGRYTKQDLLDYINERTKPPFYEDEDYLGEAEVEPDSETAGTVF